MWVFGAENGIKFGEQQRWILSFLAVNFQSRKSWGRSSLTN